MIQSKEIYQKRINSVIDHVNENLDKSFTLEELASVACFSPYHFHRIFVALTGESINFFTNRVRLQKAARMLRFSSESISIIALSCGFSSPSTFSRAFKQYFGTSPSIYRKTEIIENSKIRKELFPITEYLVPMTEEEMVANYPVKMQTFPKRRVAYIRIQDSYRDGLVLQAFADIVQWAKEKDLFASEQIFGMSIDDPLITPQDKCRYEVCITLPEDFKFDQHSLLESMIMPRCMYATVDVSGSFNFVATGTYYLFNHWLVNSSYEPEHQHGLEIYLDKEKICDWSHFELQLCIPVKTLKKY